jgi:hypothetical protein
MSKYIGYGEIQRSLKRVLGKEALREILATRVNSWPEKRDEEMEGHGIRNRRGEEQRVR